MSKLAGLAFGIGGVSLLYLARTFLGDECRAGPGRAVVVRFFQARLLRRRIVTGSGLTRLLTHPEDPATARATHSYGA